MLARRSFGVNRGLVRRHMPGIAGALRFGHDGNRGEALLWGAARGAATRHPGAHGGHGDVAHPHGILVTWATIAEGGVQVNARGERSHDGSRGCVEAAARVLAQPGGIAWTLFDARIAEVARRFEDVRRPEAAGAIPSADSPEAPAAAAGPPLGALSQTLDATCGPDPFGRDFRGRGLAPPYRAVRVTGALFHTQGGLEVDPRARVRRATGGTFADLLAAGGAACGVSGAGDAGHLSGNGLLSAVVLGRIAGAG
jgi:fumarate reductase flavoprotein subunit